VASFVCMLLKQACVGVMPVVGRVIRNFSKTAGAMEDVSTCNAQVRYRIVK
jgi:hypothetical protein